MAMFGCLSQGRKDPLALALLSLGILPMLSCLSLHIPWVKTTLSWLTLIWIIWMTLHGERKCKSFQMSSTLSVDSIATKSCLSLWWGTSILMRMMKYSRIYPTKGHNCSLSERYSQAVTNHSLSTTLWTRMGCRTSCWRESTRYGHWLLTISSFRATYGGQLSSLYWKPKGK